jgi:hypothetical protein
MLTRGRAANHLYLQVVGDGDPHAVIRPETLASRTATEILQQILARDDTPTSATTVLRGLSDPAARLFDGVQRYTDGLHLAAEQLVGPQIVEMLDGLARQVVPELTNEPSWPTLRAHLLGLAAETGEHPLLHLQTAAAGRELHTAAESRTPLAAAVEAARCPALLDNYDPISEIGAAWAVKERPECCSPRPSHYRSRRLADSYDVIDAQLAATLLHLPRRLCRSPNRPETARQLPHLFSD